MTPEASIPTSIAPLLGIAVVTLAGVVAFLWRYYSKRDEEHSKERELWVTERQRLERFQVELRAEYEAKYHETLKTLYDDAREHEATVRREYAENIEAVSQNAQMASDKVARVLDKIYETYIVPRRPPH
jgi:hypothetical protein